MKKKDFSGFIRKCIRPAAMVIGGVAIAAMTTLGSHGTKVAEATAINGMKVKFYKWDLYGEPPMKDSYMMLLWKDGSTVYYAGGNTWNGHSYIGRNINVDPYIGDPSQGTTFYTRSLEDCTQFRYKGKDGDNANGPKGRVRFSNGTELYTDGDDLSARSSGDNWTFMNFEKCKVKGAPVYTNPARAVFFYNRSVWDDTHIWHSNNGFYGRDQDGGWKYINDFYVYVPSEYYYDAMGDYTVGDDQIFRCDGGSFLLDGATLTIPKNSIVSVHGNFYCNGTIDCAGTLVIEKDGCIIPYSPTGSAGNIRLHDGGTMIIASGGKACMGLPAGCLNALKQGSVTVDKGSIINFGIFKMKFEAFVWLYFGKIFQGIQ